MRTRRTRARPRREAATRRERYGSSQLTLFPSAKDLHLPVPEIHPELRGDLLLLHHLTYAEVDTEDDVNNWLALRVHALKCHLKMGVGDRHADIATAYARERLARELHPARGAVLEIADLNILRSDDAHERLAGHVALKSRANREAGHRLVLLLPA